MRNVSSDFGYQTLSGLQCLQ